MRLTKIIDDIRVFAYRLRVPDVETIRTEEQRAMREAGVTPQEIDERHRQIVASPEYAEVLEEIRAEREQRRSDAPRGVQGSPQRPSNL